MSKLSKGQFSRQFSDEYEDGRSLQEEVDHAHEDSGFCDACNHWANRLLTKNAQTKLCRSCAQRDSELSGS